MTRSGNNGATTGTELVAVKVVRSDGKIETLRIMPGTALVSVGHIQSRIKTADGMDHYFNREGAYDGWGCGTPPGASSDDSARLRETIESIREIEDSPVPV